MINFVTLRVCSIHYSPSIKRVDLVVDYGPIFITIAQTQKCKYVTLIVLNMYQNSKSRHTAILSLATLLCTPITWQQHVECNHADTSQNCQLMFN